MKEAMSIRLSLRRLQNARVSFVNALLLALFTACSSLAILTLLSRPKSSLVSSAKPVCREPHFIPDGGDCQAFGSPRRPDWACLSEMRDAIPEFMKLYSRRIVQHNKGGMRIDHNFALWYILRKLKPSTVIESGAHNGLSTWMIRQTLPKARIFSLDPRKPARRLSGVEYLAGNDFIDFGNVNWTERRVDPANTLVFIDDHQSAYRRMFDGNPHGFKRFMIEDNYPFQGGDALSLKTVCQVQGKNQWRGFYMDDFNRKKVPQTWAEHLAMGQIMNRALSVYYEFPPLASSKFVVRKACDNRHITDQIVMKRKDFDRLFGNVDLWEFEQYVHFAYAQIK